MGKMYFRRHKAQVGKTHPECPVSPCQALTPSLLCVPGPHPISLVAHPRPISLVPGPHPSPPCQALTCLPMPLPISPRPPLRPTFPIFPVPHLCPISPTHTLSPSPCPFPATHTLILSSTSPLPCPGPWEAADTGRNQLPQVSEHTGDFQSLLF